MIHRKSLALLLTTLTLLAAAPPASPPPPAPTPSPSTQPRWHTLLQQLGDADFATRQEAQKELDKTTPADIAALRELAKVSTDEEIKSRLLARVVTIEEDLAVNPPPLSLKLENATLTEVAAAINKQMGVQFTVWPPQEDFRRNIRFTINVKDMPFHEVLTELSKQHAVSMQDFGDELRLNAQEQPATGRLLLKGPVAITPTSITRTRQFNLLVPQVPLPAERLSLDAMLNVDPRLVIQARSEPQFTDVIDDLGNVLLHNPDNAQYASFNRNVHSYNFSTTLELPEKRGTKIVSAKGVARFKIVIASDRLEIPDAAAKSGQSFEFAGQTIKLAQFAVQGTSINFNITMNKSPAGVPNINQNGLAVIPGTDQIELGMQFIDANDKSIFSNALRNGGHSGGVGRGELKPPVKVVFTLPTKIKELVVPFELKDIPLP